MFAYENCELVFEQEALEAIADEAVERDTGARGLRSICESALIDVMYDLPEYTVATRVTVTKDDIVNKTAPKITPVEGESAA
jgi:ATP-dependent Clp protease ATP-binding subunit ClpX